MATSRLRASEEALWRCPIWESWQAQPGHLLLEACSPDDSAGSELHICDFRHDTMSHFSSSQVDFLVFDSIGRRSIRSHAIYPSRGQSKYSGSVPRAEPPFITQTLRAMVGDGSIPARGINRSLLALVRSHRRVRKIGEKADERMTLPAKKSWRDIDLLAPIKMFREKDILLTLTFNSSVYMLWYALTTSTSTSLKWAQYLSGSASFFFLLNLYYPELAMASQRHN